MIDFWKNKSAKWLEIFDHIVRHRVRHYRTVFDIQDPSVQAVLKDLARFCRADKTTYGADNNLTHVLIGRREVWLRIQQHLNLPPETLTDMILGPDKE